MIVEGGGEPSAIVDLTIETNPNNVLSAYVSWTTDVPADSVVRFGVGEPEVQIASETLEREHRVFIFGMHAETEYVIEVSSSNDAGSVEAEATHTSGELPEVVPVPTLLVDDDVNSEAGWTLTNFQVGAGPFGTTPDSPAVLAMYDHDGNPVWYHVNGETLDHRGDVQAEVLSNGNLLIGPAPGEPAKEIELDGTVVWQAPRGEDDPYPHHDLRKLADGNYAMIWGDGNIVEFDADGEIVWEWRLRDYVDGVDSDEDDWCHANSVTIDKDDDAVYLNCRWLGLFKTTYEDRTLLWHLPAKLGWPEDGIMEFVPESSQYSDTHDPEIHEDGTILFYDNGGYENSAARGEPTELRSSLKEYRVDDETLEATLVWEFPGDLDVDPWFRQEWYNPFWGDADRLPNGNVLATVGLRGANTFSRIFEVTRAGEVVWHVTFPENYGTYRAERVVPPQLEPL